MKAGRESRKMARELFRLACRDGGFSEERVAAVADALVRARPRGYFGALEEFARLVRLEVGRRRAVVESAVPLDAEERAAIGRDLRAHAGDGVSLEFAVAPGLIGGLRVRLGSNVLDGSIRARLDLLASQT
jgi:F-type H+-transporting ATPase subunit delta